jgi:hypothetical protein
MTFQSVHAWFMVSIRASTFTFTLLLPISCAKAISKTGTVANYNVSIGPDCASWERRRPAGLLRCDRHLQLAGETPALPGCVELRPVKKSFRQKLPLPATIEAHG